MFCRGRKDGRVSIEGSRKTRCRESFPRNRRGVCKGPGAHWELGSRGTNTQQTGQVPSDEAGQ